MIFNIRWATGTSIAMVLLFIVSYVCIIFITWEIDFDVLFSGGFRFGIVLATLGFLVGGFVPQEVSE